MKFCLEKQSKEVCPALHVWLNEVAPGTVADLETITIPANWLQSVRRNWVGSGIHLLSHCWVKYSVESKVMSEHLKINVQIHRFSGMFHT